MTLINCVSVKATINPGGKSKEASLQRSETVEASFVSEDGERVLGKENGLCEGSELVEEGPVMEEQKVAKYIGN